MSEIVWGGQNPQGVTTGHFQAEAGSGRRTNAHKRHHVREMERARLVDPLGPVAAFVAEFQASERARSHTAAKVVGGIVGYAAGRAIGQRIGRQ